MSVIKAQQSQTIVHGKSSVTATVVQLTAVSDSFEVARMQATSNCAIQLRRPLDREVALTQSDIDTVGLVGSVGQEVLIITLHDDPAVEVVS